MMLHPGQCRCAEAQGQEVHSMTSCVFSKFVLCVSDSLILLSLSIPAHLGCGVNCLLIEQGTKKGMPLLCLSTKQVAIPA